MKIGQAVRLGLSPSPIPDKILGSGSEHFFTILSRFLHNKRVSSLNPSGVEMESWDRRNPGRDILDVKLESSLPGSGKDILDVCQSGSQNFRIAERAFLVPTDEGSLPEYNPLTENTVSAGL